MNKKQSFSMSIAFKKQHSIRMFWQKLFSLSRSFFIMLSAVCCYIHDQTVKPRKPAAPLMVCMDLKISLIKVPHPGLFARVQQISVSILSERFFRLSDKFLYDFFHFIVHFMSLCNIFIVICHCLIFGSKNVRIILSILSFNTSPVKGFTI